MTIIADNILNVWEVDSIYDFIQQFHLQEQVLKDFPDIDDIIDIASSEHFLSDDDHIRGYLEKDERTFKISFKETRHWEGWIIKEVTK